MPMILFVSGDCQYSSKFLTLMDKYWKFNEIEIVNLDDLNPDEMPDYVDKTPSILVVTGDSELLYEGQDTFDLLYKLVMDLHTLPTAIRTKKEHNNGISDVDDEQDNDGFLTSAIPGSTTQFGNTAGIEDKRDFSEQNDVLAMFSERQEMYKPSENAIREG